MGTSVYIGTSHLSGFLQMWGRGTHIWWGCVTFRARIEAGGERGELAVAAWVPASSLSRPSWSQASEGVSRITLTEDQRLWPPPPGWPHWYVGAWPNGPLVLPTGVSLLEGAAWRKR